MGDHSVQRCLYIQYHLFNYHKNRSVYIYIYIYIPIYSHLVSSHTPHPSATSAEPPGTTADSATCPGCTACIGDEDITAVATAERRCGGDGGVATSKRGCREISRGSSRSFSGFWKKNREKTSLVVSLKSRGTHITYMYIHIYIYMYYIYIYLDWVQDMFPPFPGLDTLILFSPVQDVQGGTRQQHQGSSKPEAW